MGLFNAGELQGAGGNSAILGGFFYPEISGPAAVGLNAHGCSLKTSSHMAIEYNGVKFCCRFWGSTKKTSPGLYFMCAYGTSKDKKKR